MQNHKIVLFNNVDGTLNKMDLHVPLSLNRIQSYLNQFKAEVKKEKASFTKLTRIAFNLLSQVPLPLVYYPNTHVVRARPNFNGEVFKFTHEISYNSKCPEKSTLNRFNLDKEAVFYAAAPIDIVKPFSATLTAIAESNKELFDNSNINRTQYVTISKWDVLKVFPVIMLTFFPKAEEKSEYIKESNKFYSDFFKSSYSAEDQHKIELVLSYLSDCACKKNDTANNYRLTTACFNAMQKAYGQEIGIMYSSSMTDNEGINIVLTKEIIDNNYLEASLVIMYKCSRDPRDRFQYAIHPCSSMVKVDEHCRFRLLNII